MPEQADAFDRALDELRRDPYRSDQLVADAAGVSVASVNVVRRRVPGLATPRDQRAFSGQGSGATHCDQCGAELDAGSRAERRFCGPECKNAWHNPRRAPRRLDETAETAETAEPYEHQAAAWPEVIVLPPMPDLSRGLCTTVLPSQRCWWTSSDRDEREAALRMCQGCPVRQECADWSLNLPWHDRAIWGGLTVNERQRRQRSLRQAARESALAKAIAAQLLAQP